MKWCYDRYSYFQKRIRVEEAESSRGIAYLIYEYFRSNEITERGAVTKGKGRKTLKPIGRMKNVFSGRQLGLVQEETLVVFYTRMPRETVRTTWDEVERRKKISPRASILLAPKFFRNNHLRKPHDKQVVPAR